MNFKFGKLFRDPSSSSLKIDVVHYSPKSTPDYYSFLKSQSDQGLIQLIINTKLIMKILRHYFVEESYEINSIILNEEDEEYNTRISYLIERISKNKVYFHDLISELSFISQEEYIDISTISLRKDSDNGSTIFLEIRSNGLISINEKYYDLVSNNLVSIITELISGER